MLEKQHSLEELEELEEGKSTSSSSSSSSSSSAVTSSQRNKYFAENGKFHRPHLESFLPKFMRPKTTAADENYPNVKNSFRRGSISDIESEQSDHHSPKFCEIFGFLYTLVTIGSLVIGASLIMIGVKEGMRPLVYAGSIAVVSGLGLIIHFCCHRSGPAHSKTGVMEEERGVERGTDANTIDLLSLTTAPKRTFAREEEEEKNVEGEAEAAVEAGVAGISLSSKRPPLLRMTSLPAYSSTGVPLTLKRPPQQLRKPHDTNSIFKLATEISVASARVSRKQLRQGWTGRRPRHKFHRSVSHPWDMARPENHYMEDV